MFINEIKIKISPLWEEGFNKPFVQKLIDGSLSNESFEQYLYQDMLYLEKYVKLCELALTKAGNKKEREVLYSLIEFSGLVELQKRVNFLKFKNDDNIELFFETKQYINFIMSFSEDEDNFKLMIVLMNCMLSYNYIFTKAEKQMDNFHNKYYEFVIDYVSDNYKIFYERCIGYLNERYWDISDYDKNELFKLFEKANEYELKFLDRVYKE
mgnify:FL=1